MDEKINIAKRAWTWLAISVLMLAFFNQFPQIDLWFAGLFYDDGIWFWRTSVLKFMREFYVNVTNILALSFILLAIFTINNLTKVDKCIYRFGAAFAIIGPGLIVNALFKTHWGRARPNSIAEYGGSREFTPASFMPVDNCEFNCSFVSGEGSGAAVMMFTLLMLFGTTSRRRFLIIAFALPMGFLRAAFGKHFVSDLVISFTLMWSLGYFLMLYFGLTTQTMRTQIADVWVDLRALFRWVFSIPMRLFAKS